MNVIKEIDEYLKQWQTGMPMTCYHHVAIMKQAKLALLKKEAGSS